MTTAAQKRRKWARRKQQGNGSVAPVNPYMPESWKNPRNFFLEGRVRYNQIPIAESADNRCPRCGRENVEMRTAAIIVPGSKIRTRAVLFCSCPGPHGGPFPFRPNGSKRIQESPLLLERSPARMTDLEYITLMESQGDDGLACSNPNCFLQESDDWIVSVGKPPINRVCLHCERCGHLMRPGPFYQPAN